MKNKRILALILLLCLAGCGDDVGVTEPTTVTITEPTTVTATEPTTVTTEATTEGTTEGTTVEEEQFYATCLSNTEVVDSEGYTVGFLESGDFVEVLEEGDRVRIISGAVEGFVDASCLEIGEMPEGDLYVDVLADLLNIRTGQSTESDILAQVAVGERLPVVQDFDDWVLVSIGTNDLTGEEVTGFVMADYVSLATQYSFAVSTEEIAMQESREAYLRLVESEQLKKLESEQYREEITIVQPSSLAEEVSFYAQEFVGVPYVWGGTNLVTGVDCSGFVQQIYSHFGYTIPRVSRDQAVYAGVEIAMEDLASGDLVFYGDSSGTVNHVAMYIGEGKIVHARGRAWGVRIDDYDFRYPLLARRVIYE